MSYLNKVALVIALIFIVLFGRYLYKNYLPFRFPLVSPLEKYITSNNNTLIPIVNPVYFIPKVYGTRITTAYNAVKEQCDNTPCISASGLNVCETAKTICASNEFEFGDILKLTTLDGTFIIICEVQDRTNSRYTYRIDVLMEEIHQAISFGRKTMLVEKLN